LRDKNDKNHSIPPAKEKKTNKIYNFNALKCFGVAVAMWHRVQRRSNDTKIKAERSFCVQLYLAGLLKFYKRERERNCWKLRKNFFTF
jgi:hypothetical protein